jgi:uncharacterized repeat protein (TIGR01451 family)
MGYICIGLGLLLILSSFNGGWGKAYGQTVVTPTPGLEVGDPQLTKTGEPGCCAPGDTVIYTIVATNVGTGPVTNVLITDTLPAELQLQDVTTSKGQVTIAGNYFEVRIGSIAPGEIVTIIVRALSVSIPGDGVLHNTAFLRSDQGDRQASADVIIKASGGCATPAILPPTGGPVPQSEGGVSLWLLLAGLFLLLLGIVLTVRARKQSSEKR